MTVGAHQPHNDQRQLELLSAYLDGELSETERATLEEHLATCPECQRTLAELQQIRTLLRALPEPALERSFLLPETGAIPETLSRHSPGTQARHRTGRILPAPTLQWIGSLVAVVGLFILITTTLPGHSQNSALSKSAPVNGSSSASYSTGQANPKQTPVPASTGVKVPVTLQPSYTTLSPTAMSTATASLTGRPATSEHKRRVK